MISYKIKRLLNELFPCCKSIIKVVVQRLFKDDIFFLRIHNAKGVALTFDDGPHPVHTPKIIEILKKRNIRATFFLLGNQIKLYPELVKDLIKAGHELGNHTYAHDDLKDMGLQFFLKSIIQTENEITNIRLKTHKSILLRTPYGRLNIKLLWYIRKYHIKLVGWTVDSNDSFIHDSSELIEFMQKANVKAGDILLFHEDYLHTIQALPDILDHLLMKGIKFFPVGELISSR